MDAQMNALLRAIAEFDPEANNKTEPPVCLRCNGEYRLDRDRTEITALCDWCAQQTVEEMSPRVIALLDEIERLRTTRDHSCACSVNDGSAPLVKHDKDCPIRVNARTRIAPELAMSRLAAALDSGDEADELREQLAAMTAARDEACDIAERRGAAIDYLRRQVDGYEVIKEVADEIEHGVVDRDGRARIEGAIVQPNSVARIDELRKVGRT